MNQPVLFSRQPIFDVHLNTYAYQLVSASEHSDEDHHSSNTADVVVNAFSNLLDNGHVKCLPAWVKVDASWLYDAQFPELPVDSVVFDLTLAALSVPHLEEILKDLSVQGYRICMPADFDSELQQFAHIIRLDCQAYSADALVELAQKLKQQPSVKLLADNIASFEQYNHCKTAGFDLFMGWFFAEPQLVSGRKLARNELVMFQLIGEVNSSEATVDSIEQILQRDPELVASLLKLVNSAALGGRRTISSISEAVINIGLTELKKWVLLFALCHNKQVPSELVGLLLIKAKMCQLMTEKHNHVDSGTAFMTGLLSGIDAVLGIPLPELLEQLPVQVEVKRAVQGGNNPLGKLLAQTEAYIKADWDLLPKGEEFHFVADCYTKSVTWSSDLLQELS
ncbi:EAL and HDOD domain-containing protein [Neptuniibacter sp. QD48_11]|uniref:EAL and HDOD domain-containing protein n=1 Tax=unclassified Neptuniibacter TaxID=2630693 RepID=UPI0039F5C0FC